MIGEVFGNYRVMARIGAGGMGEVYCAEHVLLSRRAALKVLVPELSRDQEIVTRFFNEARAASAIKHPGIVEIYDFGYHGSGSAYILMEFLDGESLEARLRRLRVMGVDVALQLTRQIAGALGAAHGQGIIHRDLKPDNLFVIRDPEVPGGERIKILDFGIAKLTDDDGGQKTRTGVVMGTPLYMSPEQCKGAGGVDARADLYSLGCIVGVALAPVRAVELRARMALGTTTGFYVGAALHKQLATRLDGFAAMDIPLGKERQSSIRGSCGMELTAMSHLSLLAELAAEHVWESEGEQRTMWMLLVGLRIF